MTRPSSFTLRNAALCRPRNSSSAAVVLFAYEGMLRGGNITAVGKSIIAIQVWPISDRRIQSGMYGQAPIPI